MPLNPLLAKKLQDLDALAHDLRDSFASASEALQRQHEEKENMQQEQWRLQKDLAALKRIADDFDALADLTERYKRQRAEVRAGLERILTHAKALGLDFHE